MPPPLGVLPPQPMPATEITRTSRPTIASQLRRRLGMPKRKTSARAVPPADGQNSLLVRLRALEAAVVETVRVDVFAVVSVMLTEAGDRLQVAGSLAAVGVIAQVRATLPVNPSEGVTVMVEVLPLVAPGFTVMAPLLDRANEPEDVVEVTVTVTEVVSVVEPETPETLAV